MTNREEMRKRLFLFLILLIVLSACRFPFAFAIPGEENNHTQGDNGAAAADADTHSTEPIQPTGEQSTPTQAPSENPAALETIRFKQGGTSAYRSGTLSAGIMQSFVVGASAEQTLIAGVSSSANDVVMEVSGTVDGAKLLTFDAAKAEFSGVLPASQDYKISLKTSSPAADYFLSIEIPVDVRFEPGAVSASIDGYVAVHEEYAPGVMTRVRYLVRASKGQVMTIVVDSPENENLSLGIYGQADGQPYKRYQVKGVSGSFVLPSTQGYFIDVYSLGESTPFTLTINIE